MTTPQALQQNISPAKFYPPQISAATSLFRHDLVTGLLGQGACSHKAVLIEAQAGQGKSTLAAQFLHHYNLPFAWYQIGPEDADPVLLLLALLNNLQSKLPGFTSPHLLRIMRQGEIGPLDITRCANILLGDLDHYLNSDFYIVFDDLHFAEQAELLNRLLAYLIDTSPPHLHFILLSRRPPALPSKVLRYGTDTRTLGNDDLSLNLEEVEHLFDTVLNTPIERNRAARILRQTSGWIMGILLASHGRGNSSPARQDDTRGLPAGPGSKHLLEYFRREILDNIPGDEQETLMRLALLGQFPVELATLVTGRSDIEEFLTGLMHNNFFLYPLDDRQSAFRFHHLFQEVLQEGAGHRLRQKEILRIYHTAAEYYLKKGQMEQALLFYRKEENFQAMEDFFRTQGLNMMARNRTITLLDLLKSIPDDQLLRHAWLTLFAGLLYSDFQPKKIQPLLDSARNRFIITGEETGELLALSYLIYYHFVVSGLYHTGALLLPRTEELYIRNRERLPLQARILIARNLGAGYCFFMSRMEPAREYAGIARDLSVRHDIRNGTASSRFVCGYIESLTDHHLGCLREIELSWPLLHDPLVGMSNRLTLRVLHLNYLSKIGAFCNYDYQQKILRRTIDSHVVKQTVAAPYLYIWQSAALVAVGDHARAEELLQRGLSVSETARTPHIHSQLLQWQAYIHILQGNRESALRDIAESSELRTIAGGPFYEVFHTILHGAIMARTGKHDQADELLSTALRRAHRLPSEYLAAAVLFQRAWLNLLRRKDRALLNDLEAALYYMRKNGYTFFWGWEPKSMHRLLAIACREGREAGYANRLAVKRLAVIFDDLGDPLPILSVSVLGSLRMSLKGKTHLTASSLTPAQRDLLALLLSADHLRIRQEEIQLTLWPDSPPEKTRSKLDTLLMRLRKVLDEVLNVPAGRYLCLKKGIVSLENCEVDGEEFSRLARKGLAHLDGERFWQAANALHDALRLWEGIKTPGSDLFTGESAGYHDRLLVLLAECGYRYAELLAGADSTDEAIEILERILPLHRMDDRLTALLYRLLVRSGKMLRAREWLQRYEQALRELGLADDEVAEMVLRIARPGE